MDINILSQLYFQYKGIPVKRVEALPASGSRRRYFRLYDGQGGSAIGLYNPCKEENETFVYLASHFREKHLNVPLIYAFSDNHLYYLQEDLGSVSLFDAIEKGRVTSRFSQEELALLRSTIQQLPVFQFSGAEGLDFSRCYPQSAFDRRTVLWDLHYFKYCYLLPSGVEYREDLLEDDFEEMARVLTRNQDCGFMYRDFQSRNVMVRSGAPWFIDFQGGRRGPVYYDVASFLWQARAGFPSALREELVDVYLGELQRYVCVSGTLFRERLRHFVLFRMLQVLGAYGFRGYFEGKPHFKQSIPFALRNIGHLIHAGFSQYPHLMSVLGNLTTSHTPLPRQTQQDSDTCNLTVEVVSFSYKAGVPEDTFGNGGGYVFDCRAIHNPGRYTQYRGLTGCDKEVIDFLERDGEIFPFLKHAYELVDASVCNYIQRNFSHLLVCFGCTGGQHRSVYAACKMARHISDKFGVNVVLRHRELRQEQIFMPKNVAQ